MSLTTYKKQAEEILEQMTLEEKAQLCSGKDFWHTKGVERLGVLPIMVTDGPHGLRKQAGPSDHLGIHQSVPATCFPTAAASACSFDPELLTEMGQALGEECLQEEVGVILGPGANIKRSPLCGRNFEYFSEDPYLTGVMSTALIQGIQEKGIGTSMKHYAANNQEARRMVIDAIIDERALREIYLPGYEMAVKESQPWTLMCCYNQVNGAYGSQNKELLTNILREEWGFEGAVVTDWGAVVDRVEGLTAGLDLEMPYAGPENDNAIIHAVQSGELKETVLDTTVLRVLSILLATKDTMKKRPKDYRYDAKGHHMLAQKVAAQSSVLLKNENQQLPLSKETSVALIGEFAKNPRYQGAGSSRINPITLENLYDVFSQQGIDFTYAPGYDLENDSPDDKRIQQAVEAAKEAEVSVLCLGLPDAYESEGFDREHLHLPKSHTKLLEQVAQANPHTIVLLFTGGVVEMPWIDHAQALLLLYLGGQAGASAAYQLLFGEVSPSGKLAESFPYTLEDNPSAAYFPGNEKTVEYRESIFVGYRYYDTADVDVLFPFGFGLSYTNFAYKSATFTKAEDSVRVELTVKNTGDMPGAETVQCYVSKPDSSVLRAKKELKGFTKVFLEPGEEKNVSILLDKRAFSYYDVDKEDWNIEPGAYTISLASSSQDIRQSGEVILTGDTVPTQKIPAEYQNLSAPFKMSKESFEVLYGKSLPESSFVAGEPYTMHSTLGEIAHTATGTKLLEQLQQQMGQISPEDEQGDDSMGRMFERMLMEIPVRALRMYSGGALKTEDIQTFVEQMNEEHNEQTDES